MSHPGKTVLCREYGPLIVEVGVWKRKVRKEFFAAAWSAGATRPGGIAVFGRATPKTINVDANCRRLTGPTTASRSRLQRPVRYGRTRSGLSYFVFGDSRRRSGSPLRGWGATGVGESFDESWNRPRLDVIGRRQGHGLRFRCGTAGKVVVHVRRLTDRRGRPVGSSLSVKSAAHPWLLAEARLTVRGRSWFRISRLCERDRF